MNTFMKKLIFTCLTTALLLPTLAIAQIGNDLDTTLDNLSDFALAAGVNDAGETFYTLDSTEFSFEVQSELVKNMSGTAVMNEDGIAFVSKLYAVATGYGDEMETGFINFFSENLEGLSAEEELFIPIDQVFSMSINVTGEEAPYDAAFSLYIEEVAAADFPSSPHSKGPADAEIVIREFSDLQCPACQRFHQETMPYVEELIAEGRIRFEFHHLPLASIHPNAIGAARAIECVSEYNGAEGFWEFHDKLYTRQTAWSNLDDPSNYFVRLSDELGLESEDIKTCITDERYDDLVTESMINAQELGLNSTPSVFVNGYRISNWLDTENFEQTMILAKAFAEDIDSTNNTDNSDNTEDTE